MADHYYMQALLGGELVLSQTTCCCTRVHLGSICLLSRRSRPYSMQMMCTNPSWGHGTSIRAGMSSYPVVNFARASPQNVHVVSASSISLSVDPPPPTSLTAAILPTVPLGRQPTLSHHKNVSSMVVRRNALLRDGPFSSRMGTPNRSSPW